MSHLPVTYYFHLESLPDDLRPYIMQEFAGAGAKHLVLTDSLLARIAAKPNFADTLMKEMADFGMTFLDSHAQFGHCIDLNCPFPEKRKVTLALHKLTLEICSYMKVGTITMHVGNFRRSVYGDVPHETQTNMIKEALAELLPVAEKCGITICIENIWFPSNSPDALLDIKKEFPTGYLGFCYDAGHANIMAKGCNYPTSAAHTGWEDTGDGTPVWENQALEKMLPYVVNCHLHDNDGSIDSHYLPGMGSVDWNHVCSLLAKAPKLRVIQSEVVPTLDNVTIVNLTRKFSELSQLINGKHI